MKKVSKNTMIQLEYFVGKTDAKEGIYEGGVCEPKYLEELKVDVVDEEIFDFDKDAFIKSGNSVIHIRGSKRVLEELGVYLIALSKYETEDNDYHDHFENISSANGEKNYQIVVHGADVKNMSRKKL